MLQLQLQRPNENVARVMARDVLVTSSTCAHSILHAITLHISNLLSRRINARNGSVRNDERKANVASNDSIQTYCLMSRR